MDIAKLVQAGICTEKNVETFGVEIDRVAAQYEIDENPKRLYMWLAQIGFESGACKHLEENLNYSAERLLVIFPHLFTEEEAKTYANHPKEIGSRIYANRFGNGDELSGEGYAYRGRGLIQLTFKSNYASFGNAIGMHDQIIHNPDLVATPQYAVESAGWFWQKNGINTIADSDNFEGVTKKINGGTHGLKERQALYKKVMGIFIP
jgi:putative chitinase